MEPRGQDKYRDSDSASQNDGALRNDDASIHDGETVMNGAPRAIQLFASSQFAGYLFRQESIALLKQRAPLHGEIETSL